MFQQLTTIGFLLRPADKVSYLINGIKEFDDDMNTGKSQQRTKKLERK